MLTKWWVDREEGIPHIDNLPPLGNALLKMLVDHYGRKEVAKAAQIYLSSEEKAAVLARAGKELEQVMMCLMEDN